MTLRQLKRKYLIEGFKRGRSHALTEGWSYRRTGPDRNTAPNRLSKEEWKLIYNSFKDAADDCWEEVGYADFETVADHWGQIFIDDLIEGGISARRLRNARREIANAFASLEYDSDSRMDGTPEEMRSAKKIIIFQIEGMTGQYL